MRLSIVGAPKLVLHADSSVAWSDEVMHLSIVMSRLADDRARIETRDVLSAWLSCPPTWHIAGMDTSSPSSPAQAKAEHDLKTFLAEPSSSPVEHLGSHIRKRCCSIFKPVAIDLCLIIAQPHMFHKRCCLWLLGGVMELPAQDTYHKACLDACRPEARVMHGRSGCPCSYSSACPSCLHPCARSSAGSFRRSLCAPMGPILTPALSASFWLKSFLHGPRCHHQRPRVYWSAHVHYGCTDSMQPQPILSFTPGGRHVRNIALAIGHHCEATRTGCQGLVSLLVDCVEHLLSLLFCKPIVLSASPAHNAERVYSILEAGKTNWARLEGSLKSQERLLQRRTHKM